MKDFEKIIGYATIKKELAQIADILKNVDSYQKLDVKAPRGLMLYGVPGVGKSMMADALIRASGRPAFVCRKDQPNGDFVREIKATFDQAVENAPSIVFLDDMDKFANGDKNRPDAEEYVTVQSCIDQVKGKAVFVLATVNNRSCLPASLCRAGRFDREIRVCTPRGKDSREIISYYLQNKAVSEDLDTQLIADIMDGRSCAELETVINEAGLYAGYERAETITMEHILHACLSVVFGFQLADDEEENSARFRQIVCHEIGHAVVSEILCPDSVTVICANDRAGFTAYHNDRTALPLYWRKSRIVSALGGIAAEEQNFGVYDLGGEEDLDLAFDRTRDLVNAGSLVGFRLHGSGYTDSNDLLAAQERVTALEVDRFYGKAKEILAQNGEFFHKLCDALTAGRMLTAPQVQEIKRSCVLQTVAL